MLEPLRILMADGNCPVREGARRLLEDSDVVVAAAVGSAPDLLNAVERLRPAAVLGCAGGPVSGGRLATRRRRR
jgi:CheY-like chemotaxis protein